MTSSASLEPTAAEAGPEPTADGAVGQIVSAVAITVAPTATLREVAVQMTANDIGLVVVAGSGRLQGVVSERDLVRALAEESDPDDERASDVMSVDLVSAEISTPVAEAADLMLEGGVRHLPVVDKDRVVGIVSIRDLLPMIGRA